MPTTAELQERLDNLRELRSQGTLTVTFTDGRSVTYRSDAELAAAIADLERQLAPVPPVSVVYVTATKGLTA